MNSFWSQFNTTAYQKRQCPDYDFAVEYKERLLVSGFSYAEVVKENGKYYVKYRRY